MLSFSLACCGGLCVTYNLYNMVLENMVFHYYRELGETTWLRKLAVDSL